MFPRSSWRTKNPRISRGITVLSILLSHHVSPIPITATPRHDLLANQCLLLLLCPVNLAALRVAAGLAHDRSLDVLLIHWRIHCCLIYRNSFEDGKLLLCTVLSDRSGECNASYSCRASSPNGDDPPTRPHPRKPRSDVQTLDLFGSLHSGGISQARISAQEPMLRWSSFACKIGEYVIFRTRHAINGSVPDNSRYQRRQCSSTRHGDQSIDASTLDNGVSKTHVLDPCKPSIIHNAAICALRSSLSIKEDVSSAFITRRASIGSPPVEDVL